MKRRKFLQCLARAGIASGALGGLPLEASGAEVYPARPVRVVVPYPAGGVVDIAARIVSDRLSADLGQPFLIENRAGANGNIGAETVKGAAPDGYTLLVGSMFLVVNPLIDKTARYSVRDFEPIASIGAPPNILVVPASSPAKSLSDLVAAARGSSRKFNTPNPGTGSSNHLGLELFLRAAHLEMVQIGYKGQPPFMADLINGQLDFAFVTAALAIPHVQSGKLRALAIDSTQRLKALRDVPTIGEAGFPDAVVLPWNAFFAPTGTPAAVLATLGAGIERALRSTEVTQRFDTIHGEVPREPRQFNAFLAEEQNRWPRVVAERKIQAEL